MRRPLISTNGDVAGFEIRYDEATVSQLAQEIDEQALTAVHQGSGGLFRKANHLARGALIAAAAEKSQHVTADHVRTADSELL